MKLSRYKAVAKLMADGAEARATVEDHFEGPVQAAEAAVRKALTEVATGDLIPFRAVVRSESGVESHYRCEAFRSWGVRARLQVLPKTEPAKLFDEGPKAAGYDE